MNTVTTKNQYQLAGRGARLGAALLDLVIFAVCLAPGLVAMSGSESGMGNGVGIALLIIAWLAFMTVQLAFLVMRGQSLGKMAVGIKIVRVSDETVPGFVKLFLLRAFVPNLLYGIPYLGVVLLLVDLLFIFREDRRCLHDLIAETKVVDASLVTTPAIATPAFTAPASPAYVRTTSPEVRPYSTLQTSLETPTFAPITFDEDAFYEVVANEIESGKTDKGLWTRLFAELDGDEKKTKIAYIKQRAEKLIANERIRVHEQEERLSEEAAQIERQRIESLSLWEQLSSGNMTPDVIEKLKSLSATREALTLMSNVRLNKIEQVSEFLEGNQLYVAITNSEGMSPLHVSVSERYVDMSKLLIQKGAPVSMKNIGGQTPLDIARNGGNQELIALLSANS